MRNRKLGWSVPRSAACVAALLVASGSAAGDALLIGPRPYREASDSPFWELKGLMLDTLEDGQLNLAGVVPHGGFVLGPTANTDSVDADDGVIDGNGRGGHSWWISEKSLEVRFDEGVLGQFPTRVGLVWTDGRDVVTFEAYGPDGELLGTLTGDHPDGVSGGGTEEDRFYGVRNAEGVSKIIFRNSGPWAGIEVDHFQYILPAPGGAVLIAAAGMVGGLRRRRVGV